MKNNIINLQDGKRIFVMDETNYKNKKYVFGVEIDSNERPIEENVYTLEVDIVDDKLITSSINDFEIASVVNNIFLAKMINEE